MHLVLMTDKDKPIGRYPLGDGSKPFFIKTLFGINITVVPTVEKGSEDEHPDK